MKVGNAIRPESRRSCIVNESAESVGRERERDRQTDRQTERQRAREPPSWQTAEEFHFGPPSLGSSHARPPALTLAASRRQSLSLCCEIGSDTNLIHSLCPSPLSKLRSQKPRRIRI